VKNPKEKIYNFKPSKRLGQNFLKEHSVVNKICEAAELDGNDTVIEVGPGFGILTESILERVRHLFAIEKDKKLFHLLKNRFSDTANINIVNDDVLGLDFKRFNRKKDLKFVSNLPYNITSPVLSILLENRDLFSVIVIMVQKEVGERLASAPEKKNYGSLSVISQTYYDIKKVCNVPRTAFSPKPKVDSIVLKLVPITNFSNKIRDSLLYKNVVNASFSSKRKMIGNSLKSSYDKETIVDCLERSRIDGKRRAETLTVEEFVELANNFYQLQQSIS